MAVPLLGALLGGFGVEAGKGLASAADTGLAALFGARVSEILADAEQAVRAYTGPLPPNHDLERALRCAQLTACLILVRIYAHALEAEQAADGTLIAGRNPPFLAKARDWLHEQLGLCPRLTQVRDDAFVAQIDAALDEMLRSGAPEDTARARVREMAEASWQELEAGAGPMPAELREAFFGPKGWAMAFRALVQDALKKRPLVRDAFITSRLAALRDSGAADSRVLAALAGGVAEIAHTTRATKADTEALLAQGAQHTAMLERLLAAQARAAGVDPEVLRPIFEHLGQMGLSPAEIAVRAKDAVAAILDRARQLPAPNNDGADINAAIKAARDRLARLDTQGALGRIRAKLAEEEEARRQRMVPLLAEQAAIERLTYDYPAAKATLERLLALAPDEVWRWIELGDLCATMGNSRAALAAGRSALAAAERTERGGLTAMIGHLQIGKALRAQGEITAALDEYRKALGISARRANADSVSTEWQRGLSVCHTNIGDVFRAQGKVSAALPELRKGMEVAMRLSAAHPANPQWARDVVVGLTKIGDVLRAEGKSAAALAEYRKSMAIVGRRAAANPASTDWLTDLKICHDRIGDVLLGQGKGAAALGEYRRGMAISARLASEDAGNTSLQRDLSVSHVKIGDVLLEQGDGEAAAAEFRQCMAITARLASTDPANTEWQRDLSICHVKVGDALIAVGDGAAALDEYRKAMEVTACLTAIERANAEWQRDLVVQHVKIGGVLEDREAGTAALTEYRKGMDIATRLVAVDPANATWQRDLAVSRRLIGGVLLAQGEGAAALAEFRAAHAIVERISGRDQKDVWARNTSVMLMASIGMLRGAEGRAELEAALAVLRRMPAVKRLGHELKAWIPEIEARLAALDP